MFRHYHIIEKTLIFSVLLIPFIACRQSSENTQAVNTKTGIAAPLLSQVDSYLVSYVERGFSGVVLIADEDGIVFHKAFNAKGDQVDTSTAFYIASNSKSFVAAAIMQLQERGKLQVTDSINKYLSGVPTDKKGVTIHHLLTHTSGFDYCECTDGEMDREKVIKSILAYKLKNRIGEKWAYQNENYYLLEYIVTQVTGMSFKEYAKTHILKPAGMLHTGFWGYEKEIPVAIAPIHDSIKSQPLYKKIFKDGLPAPILFSGMFSTSNDLYKWTVALQQKKIMSDSNLSASFTPYENAVIRNENDTAIYYGYGWIPTMTKGERIYVFHAGREDWMMNNRIYMLDNGVTVIVWAMDKTGPDGDAMATGITKELVSMLQKME